VETDQLSKLIDAKHGVLLQLYELAQRQHALAESAQPGELISLLAVKQRLLDDLSTLEQQLDPFRQQDPQTRVWRSPADRARCAGVAGTCRQLLDQVMTLERDAMEVLQSRQQQTSATIRSANDAADARSAYLNNNLSEYQRLDLASER
jgi:hypothetical protein